MNRKAAWLVILVFLLGLALGGLSMHLAAKRFWAGPPGPKDSARILQEMTRDLSLTPEQQKQLAAIVEDTKAKYHAIYEQYRPQIEQVRQEGRQRIRAILTKDQQAKFEARLERMDQERKKRTGH